VKLAMTLLVRDEADVIALNLDYHFAQGVDHAIVTDNRSVDGTSEILRRYADDGRITLIDEQGEDFSAWRWRTRMSQLAGEQGADWVITNDADEFWWPREGTLRSVFEAIPENVGVVVARRSNFAAGPDDERPFWERMTLRETASTNPIGKPLPPKVAHRGDPGVTVGQGNHKVEGVEGKHLESGALEVLHYPWRSYEQFEQKVVTMGEAYARNTELPEGTGRARRWLFDEYKAGRLPEVYAERRVDAGEPPDGFVTDTRLRDYLRELAP
jgi:hypothetical protein